MRSCRPTCRRTSLPRRSDRSTTPSIASSGFRFGLNAESGERLNWRTSCPEPVAPRPAQGDPELAERVEGRASPRDSTTCPERARASTSSARASRRSSPRAGGAAPQLLTGIRVILIFALALQVMVSAAPPTDLAVLERHVTSEPENLRIAAEYRQAAIGAGEFDRSIRFLERLAQQSGGPNVYISLALAYVDKVPPSGDIRRLYLGREIG